MPFYAYIPRCADGSTYSGHTDNLENRIMAHQRGYLPGYTRSWRPISLAWSEEFPSREEALAAERQIKGWTRAKKEALISGDRQRLRELAIPANERRWRGPREDGVAPDTPRG